MSQMFERIRAIFAIFILHFLFPAFCFLPSAAHTQPSLRPVPSTEVPEETRQQLVTSYGNLPLSFEANRGQTDDRVRFLSRGSGYTLFLTRGEAVLSLRRPPRLQNDDGGHSELPEGKRRISSEMRLHDEILRRGVYPELCRRAPQNDNPHSSAVDSEIRNPKSEIDVVRLHLLGANPDPEVAGIDEQPGRSNYLIGNDPAKWRTDVPHYGKVRYRQVYPGIDLVYYGTDQRRLEYDFVVAPGADPGLIRLSFEGADALRLDGDGNLVLHAPGGEVILQAPVAYQEVGGMRRRVHSHFVLGDRPNPLDPPSPRGKGEDTAFPNRCSPPPSGGGAGGGVSFALAPYDTTHPLIIDPVLSYSTYLGGSGQDYGHGIAVDGSGSAYITGYTRSTNFPTQSPYQASNGSSDGGDDVFVAKLNASGSALVYSTYLGGDRIERGLDIAVDGSGSAYITGLTTSTNFPTANPYQALLAGGYGMDAFVAKLNVSGSALIYSTYLGGSGGEDRGWGIAVDGSGNAYVTGDAGSTNFPLASPLQGTHGGGSYDAFVTKLNTSGSTLVYSTYLGGSSSERGFGITVDGSGNAYVTGVTASTNFPTASPFQASLSGGDAFVTKLNASGSALVYSTYLGGSSAEVGHGIAVDGSGNAYVTGVTLSTNFPTVSPYQAFFGGSQDVFVAKLNASGSALTYSTYLGGSDHDFEPGIAVDGSGNAYVAGWTYSTNFPTVNALDASFNGTDTFVTKLNASGSALVYSTYLGGSGGEGSGGIAVDGSGNAYVAGWTSSTNFPTASPLQASNGGGVDGFVAKLSSAPPPTVSINDVSVAEGNTGTVNADFTVSLSNPSQSTVTVDFSTANGTATAPGDYASQSGTLTFNPGQTSKTITVVVNGDATNEPDETFNVNLTNPSNATIADAQGVGTITNDDPVPSISINDVTVTEGNSGTVNAVFTVSLSAASGQTVTVDFATADGTATAPGDYISQSGTLTFNPGEMSKTVAVQVNGDATNEPDETFNVNLTNPSNATIADAQGVGTITNDDPVPSISINDVTVTEGNSGTVNATFTVTLSAASGQTVTVDYATANGTATAPGDYTAIPLTTLTFNPGETTKTITVQVNGDETFEPNETFFVNLSNPTNATIADEQGQGTITNDDPLPTLTVVTSSPNPSSFGQMITFTATVTGNGNSVTQGTVTFKEGTTVLTELIALDLSGQASFSTSGLSGGSHTVTAEYSGSSGIAPSSGSVTQTVNKAPTQTSVTASPNPSNFGQSVTFTATVTGASGPVTEGTVTFKEGTTVLTELIALDLSGQASFSTSGLSGGSHTVTAEYGGSGNFAFSSSSVTVKVNRPPVADAGSDQTVECASHAGASVTLDGSKSSDPDGDSLTYTWREGSSVIAGPGGSPTSQITLSLGGHTITLTVDDGKGGTATDDVAVTVKDTTPPVLTTPANVTVECTGHDGQSVDIGQATATDACDSAPTVTNDAPSLFKLGTTTVTWTATDASGNKATATQTVKVQDTTSPTLTAPANVTVECTAHDGQAVSLGTATATDICDSSPTVTNDASSLFKLGTTTVTWTATDASGNKATANQTVTVVDTTPPVLTAPANVTVECSAHDGQAVDIGQAIATDICDPSPTVTHNAPEKFKLGTTTVTWMATDKTGNKTIATQTVTVVDTTPPKITFTVSPTELWPPDHRMVKLAPVISVTDACDPAPAVNIGVTSNEPDNGLGDGDTAPDWEVMNNDVSVRAERSGKGSGRVYTITVTATDASKNSATSTATVTVGRDQGKKAKVGLAKAGGEAPETLPEAFSMDQSYPNPFNPATTIRYALPEASDVQLTVYNILGQRVRVLVQGHQQAGRYTVVWDGRDDYGREVSSGVYLSRFVSKGLAQTQKMVLLR